VQRNEAGTISHTSNFVTKIINWPAKISNIYSKVPKVIEKANGVDCFSMSHTK